MSSRSSADGSLLSTDSITDTTLRSESSDVTSPMFDAYKTKDSLLLRIAAAMYSFFVLGLFQSSIGVLLPPLSKYYGLTDLHVSLIFLSLPFGYIIAAQCSNFIHVNFGQRGIAMLSPLFFIASAAIIAFHPPFLLVCAAFMITGLGTGLIDGSWCAWAGAMSNANLTSGLLHGSFSLGAAAGPLLASIMMSKGHRPWYTWFYVLFGASVLELVILPFAFRYESSSRYREQKHHYGDNARVNWKAIFKHRATWISCLYFLTYAGAETAVSGWLVSFMERSRNASPYLAGLSASGFWAGMAVGRLSLGSLTDRFGVRRAMIIYFLCAIAANVLFVIVSSPALSVAIITLLGFLLGPMFPSGVVVLTQLLPQELHVAAVSFVASLGQVGAALLPFAIGGIVQAFGIWVFRYTMLVQLVLSLGVWMVYARLTVSEAGAYSEVMNEEEPEDEPLNDSRTG